jgi:hypothetical protein
MKKRGLFSTWPNLVLLWLIFNLCNEPWFYNQENPGFASQASAPVKAWIQRVSKAGILAMTGTN